MAEHGIFLGRAHVDDVHCGGILVPHLVGLHGGDVFAWFGQFARVGRRIGGKGGGGGEQQQQGQGDKLGGAHGGSIVEDAGGRHIPG